MPADLQAIRNATDPWTLYSSAIRLKKLPGNVAIGLCVFHSEKTGSFRVNLRGHRFAGKFHCHGCDTKGDIFDFVRHIDGCDLPTAIRTLAADAGIAIDNTQQTAEQIRQRERDKIEKEICQWHFRQEWQKARRGLNRAMQAWAMGNPFADDIATIHGTRLRWIERERGTALGLAEFRASKTTERHYREWLSGHLARYAARLDFVALVLDNGIVR